MGTLCVDCQHFKGIFRRNKARMASTPALLAAAKHISPLPMPVGYIPRGQIPKTISLKPGHDFNPRIHLERPARVDYRPRHNDINYADVLFDTGAKSYVCLSARSPSGSCAMVQRDC